MNTANNALKRHVCDGPIPFGHRAHRGLLINTIASLRSNLLTAREQLGALRKKRWSKHHIEQHKKDLAMIRVLEERIPRDEQLLAELQQVNEECYG